MRISEIEALKASVENDVDDLRLFAMTNYNGLGSKPRVIKFSVLNEVVDQLKIIVSSYLGSMIEEMRSNEVVDVPLFDYNQDQLVAKIDQREMLGADDFSLDVATDYFDIGNIQLNRVRAWVVKVVVGEDDSYFMQRFYPSKMVIKDGIRLMRREDNFALVDGDILSFRPKFDCFFSDNCFVVNDMDSFEAIFGFDVAHRERSEMFFDQAQIGGLSRMFSLTGTDTLRDRMMASKRFVRKLASIMRERRFEMIDLTKLGAVVCEYSLPINVDVAGGSIEVTESTTCETLLSVLNDEYNVSMTTPFKYLAQKKKQL